MGNSAPEGRCGKRHSHCYGLDGGRRESPERELRALNTSSDKRKTAVANRASDPKDGNMMSTSTQSVSVIPPAPAEAFVDSDNAANYLRTTRRHVLEMAREGTIPGYPLDPHAKKKDWRFLLSELHAYMLSCDQRPPGARKPP